MNVKTKLLLGLVATILFLDQLTKFIVDRTMVVGCSITVIPNLFSLTYIRNPGSAFGMFSRLPAEYRLPFLVLFSIVAIIFILLMVRRLPADQKGLVTALAFILGGAIGNLVDRVAHGEVIDFLDFYWPTGEMINGPCGHHPGYHWPAFNIADSFITVGVLITVFYLIRAKGEDPFATPRR